MSYIKKSLPKVASLGLVGMMLVSAMPGNQASASEQVTPNTATQEVAQQALQEYLNSKGQVIKSATAEQLRQPFAPELYHVRDQFSDVGKKVWDLALKELLEFDPANNYEEGKLKSINGGRGLFTLDLEKAGIEATESDVRLIRQYLVAGEPRMFLLQNYDGPRTKGADGKIKTMSFEIKSQYMQDGAYYKALQDIEKVVSEILAPVNDQMTDAQKINAFYNKYKANNNYVKGPSLQDIDGAFLDKQVVCGGYTKGFQYLALRSGVKTMWVNGQAGGVAHAWNYTELDGKWYFVDSTWDDNTNSKSFFLKGAGALRTHAPHPDYTKMATLNEADYDRGKLLWLLPEEYEEQSKKVIEQVKSAVKRGLDSMFLGVPDIGTFKTSLPVGIIYNNSGNPFAPIVITKIREELNKLSVDGHISITVDNSARRSSASAVIQNGLTVEYQPVTGGPEYRYAAGKFSVVQPEVVEPEVVEKTGEQVAREAYATVAKELEAILTKYQDELSQVNDVMVIAPKEDLDYVGKTPVEQKVHDELLAELESKVLGRVAVMISGKAEYKTPQDFIANGVLVGYQGVDGKYYQFTKGDQMSVYGE